MCYELTPTQSLSKITNRLPENVHGRHGALSQNDSSESFEQSLPYKRITRLASVRISSVGFNQCESRLKIIRMLRALSISKSKRFSRQECLTPGAPAAGTGSSAPSPAAP